MDSPVELKDGPGICAAVKRGKSIKEGAKFFFAV
jgi:hypothetical protein